MQWFGRVIGNHHLGHGPARDVDVLKGANCAFRASLLRAVGFDARLHGAGAQMYWELGVCLPLRRIGWRLVYDPVVAVDHDVAPRHDADTLHRGVFAATPLHDAVHNETVELLEGRSLPSRAVFMIWALLVGTVEGPGLVQCVRRLLHGDPVAVRAWRAALGGRLAGAFCRSGPRSCRLLFGSDRGAGSRGRAVSGSGAGRTHRRISAGRADRRAGDGFGAGVRIGDPMRS